MDPKIEIERVVIGPDRARELLDANPRNRSFNKNIAEGYSRMMKEGKWPFVADPIRVSTEEFLLDGQKRLWAVEDSGVPLDCVLVTGLPPESQDFMDIGQRRTASDVYTIHGVSSPTLSASITNMLMRYEMGKLVEARKYVISPSELLAYYQDPASTKLINDAGKMAKYVANSGVRVSPAVIGAVHVLVSRISDPFAVAAFYEKLAKGYGLSDGEPVAALRNWLLRRHAVGLRATPIEHFWLAVRSWNEQAVGGTLHRMQLPSGGITSSSQIPPLLPAGELPMQPPTEDDPYAIPTSFTRKENERRKAERERRRAG